MKAQELFEKYPKAAEVVISHYADTFVKSIEESDTPEEFKEFARQQRVDDHYVAEFIDNNPRGAFDVFDANKIYITTPVSMIDGYFSWKISVDEQVYEHENAEYLENRKLAEAAAIEKAFEILNEKL